MFQIKHGQSPEIVGDVFAQTTQHYDFRQNRDFRIRPMKSFTIISSSIYKVIRPVLNFFFLR